MLDGRLGLLEGVRKIDRLRRGLRDARSEVFDAVNTAAYHADRFPAEAERYVSEAAAGILSACRAIVAAYDHPAFLAAIAEVLLHEWNPIGARDVPGTGEVCDRYAPEIAEMLDAGDGREQILDFLRWLETTQLDLDGNHETTERCADMLVAIGDRFRPDRSPPAHELIRVQLLSAGTGIYVSVSSRQVSDSVYILDDWQPSDQVWEFPPGARVTVSDEMSMKGMPFLVAVAKA